MNDKTSESEKTVAQVADTELNLNRDLWELCTYFGFSTPGNPLPKYELDRGLRKVALLLDSKLLFRFEPPLDHLWLKVGDPGYPWHGKEYSGEHEFDFWLDKPQREKVYSVSVYSPLLTGSFDILYPPDDLRGNATFEVENVDQGDHDILLTYSQYYKVKINLRDDWVEFMGSVKSITFPENAKYFVEVMTGAKSLANEGGTNHADSFQDGTYLFRMRYKNVDDVYYGPVELVLNYENGVKHTLPVEVIKKEVLEAAPGFKL